MAKWADYCVTHVRYNTKRTHIDSVKMCEDKGDSLGSAMVVSRQWVVESIEQNTTFVTAPPGEEGKIKEGARVEIIVVNGEKYLRTDANSKAADNLGNLPEF